ncbi:MAG: hypothetical protein HY254_16560 [Burkholderiales bacterium]|nr:hypothetical protein [Burkholderiales bacterium]
MNSDDSTKPKGSASQIFLNGDGAKPRITQTIFFCEQSHKIFPLDKSGINELALKILMSTTPSASNSGLPTTPSILCLQVLVALIPDANKVALPFKISLITRTVVNTSFFAMDMKEHPKGGSKAISAITLSKYH